ncbi:MAG: amidohydrolase family protein [Sandaracinaceae bacterium]|nr:amidohydrolase family protein [Sandaracinaceae bacterium]
MSAEKIIDAWMQHPTQAFIDDPMFASLRRWMRADGKIDPPSAELTVMAFRSAGVTRAVACGWHGPRGAIISNDEVAELVRAAPDLFVGLASVDLAQPMAAVRELRRAVRELGLIGLRMLPWIWGLPPNDRRYYPLYAECVELGVPFCLQVGHTGPLRTSEVGRPIPYLDDVALDFPELVIVAGHIGWPWTSEMIALATKYPNVYIDTSAYKPSRYPQELVQFMSRHGRKKVLFGTNYPMIMPHAALPEVASLGLDDEARRLFLHDNAARVFKL